MTFWLALPSWFRKLSNVSYDDLALKLLRLAWYNLISMSACGVRQSCNYKWVLDTRPYFTSKGNHLSSIVFKDKSKQRTFTLKGKFRPKQPSRSFVKTESQSHKINMCAISNCWFSIRTPSKKCTKEFQATRLKSASPLLNQLSMKRITLHKARSLNCKSKKGSFFIGNNQSIYLFSIAQNIISFSAAEDGGPDNRSQGKQTSSLPFIPTRFRLIKNFIRYI